MADKRRGDRSTNKAKHNSRSKVNSDRSSAGGNGSRAQQAPKVTTPPGARSTATLPPPAPAPTPSPESAALAPASPPPLVPPPSRAESAVCDTGTIAPPAQAVTAESPASSILESTGPQSTTEVSHGQETSGAEVAESPGAAAVTTPPPATPPVLPPAAAETMRVVPKEAPPAAAIVAPPPPAPDAPADVARPPENLPQAGLLFEVAWEVCWQLGGIYTVLKTKAACMVDRWQENYCMVGPYNPASAEVEFEDAPPDTLMEEVLRRLRQAGIEARFGHWLIPGKPRAVLIDHRSRYMRLHEDKYLLWKDHGISTPQNDGELNDVIAFGFAAAEFFRCVAEVVREQAPRRPVLAHFHEWMGGVAVPRIAHLRLPIATVFTTHATLLGRYLASDNPHFYEHLPFTDPDREAAHFNIFPRYAIEKAAAHACTVFSTVSRVTALEAGRLLGREPEAVLPNGLNIARFTAIHEFQNMHRVNKERIHDFVMGHFFPAYEFDLDNTVYVFTSGRYEYRNKGMDLFVEAMARLNWRMKSERSNCTVVAFLVTRAPTRSINVGVLQNQTMFEELKGMIEVMREGLGPKMLRAAASGRFPKPEELFGDDDKIRWKRSVVAWKNRRQPTIVTHDLLDDARDPVLTHVRHRGLFNAADDPVKFIFHPDFMSATSPLLHLDYDQFVRGCHMGIFPSYYEPWGYTPMEAIALGIPAITSDLAGFGAYVQEHVQNHEENGIHVIRRRNRSFDDACNEIVEKLYQFTRLNRRQRIDLRNKVEGMGMQFDWAELVKHYHAVHELAYAKCAGHLTIRTV